MFRSQVSAALSGLSASPDADEVVGAILDEAGPLPQIALAYEPELRMLWLTIRPEPKPVFTLECLTSVTKVQSAIHRLWKVTGRTSSCPIKFLSFRGEGPVFTLGGDLDFYLDCIATGDRASLREYARVSAAGALWNASGIDGVLITLSTIHAKAVGGGIDAPRSCNVMIAEEPASFIYPEVKFNHFPITAVPVLSRCMGPREAQRVLMSGAEYSAQAFHRVGGLDAVVPAGSGEAWIRDYASECMPMHGARTALFTAFHRRTRMAEELEHTSAAWVDCMLRLTPLEVSKLQRIARAQERMLARLF
jgi:DSF synthase